MLLVPLTPIFLPTRSAMVVIREFAVTTSARVSGRRVEASARMRNLAPAGLRRDVADVASGADVDLALQLGGDHRLAARLSS